MKCSMLIQLLTPFDGGSNIDNNLCLNLLCLTCACRGGTSASHYGGSALAAGRCASSTVARSRLRLPGGEPTAARRGQEIESFFVFLHG